MTHTYHLDDIDLHVAVRGHGAPLVLLHAFPFDHSMWEAQLAHFAARWRVIAPDQRGFGRSSLGCEPFTIERLAEDLAHLLDAARIMEPVIVCGLSMGGYAALQFHRAHPHRVRALVLCDTRAGTDTAPAAADRRALAEQVRRHGAAAAVDVMLPKLLGPVSARQQPAMVDRVRSLMLAAPPETLIAALHALATRPDATAHLAHIRVPTAAIVGEHDAITTPEVMRALADAIPDCSFTVIPDAGHLSALETPDRFNAALDTFLAGPLSTPTSP